jgi:putative ABC transport system substrate-binding protein
VSVVFTSDAEAYRQAWNGFKSELAAENVAVSASEFVLGKDEPKEISAEINKRRPDLALTFGTKASRLATESIVRTPVIFCMVLDPTGMFHSNTAGVMMEVSPEAKLQMIRKILPGARRIGTVYSSETFLSYAKVLEECGQMGMSLVARKVETENELAAAVKEVARKSDCFLMLPDTKIYTPASVKAVLLESLRDKFPVIGLSSHYTKAGALFSLDSDYNEVGKQAAEIAVRILRGEDPRNIAPVLPRKCRLSVNMAVAQRMGIDIPARIVKEAIEVYGT